jgi:putative transcriptional regulator
MYTRERIRAIRKGEGLAVKEFAHALGVSYETVRSWENGRRHPCGSAEKALSAYEGQGEKDA